MTSRFKGIFDARQQEAEATEAATEEAPLPSPAPTEVPKPRVKGPEKRAEPKPAPQVTDEPKPRGRPAGKRSNGDYGQVTAYIRKETHLAVKQILLADGGTKEFSELVQELLVKWLKSRT